MRGKRKRDKREGKGKARIFEFRADGITTRILAIAVLVKAIEGLIQALTGPG